MPLCGVVLVVVAYANHVVSVDDQNEKRHPLTRLYRTKLMLIAVLATVAGLGLLVLAQLPALKETPLDDLGSALLTAGLITIVYDYVINGDNEQRAIQRARSLYPEQAQAMRDAVIEGFAVTPDDLARVASQDTLNSIAVNVLALQLGDADLARSAYRELRSRVATVERRYSCHVAITLMADATMSDMYRAVVRYDYEAQPAPRIARFAAVAGPDDYRRLQHDPTLAGLWTVRPGSADEGATYRLMDYRINGESQRIDESIDAHTRLFTVTTTGTDVDEPTNVSYTYHAHVPKAGNVMWLDIVAPTRGLRASMTIDDSAVTHIDVLDMTQQTSLHRAAVSSTATQATATTNDWVLPGARIAFIWSR